MKIVLVTKIGKNYGALLQAYALKRTLENLDNDVNILYYDLDKTKNTYRLLPRVNSRSSFIKFLASIKRLRATKQSVKCFLEFREKYFNFTRVYNNYNELCSDSPLADVYITGSDQVWNPKINFDPAYYLMFGNEDAIRVSYAASIGISKIPEKYEEEFISRVKKIEHRSVREESAKQLLEEYGITSTVHVDPTLLLKQEDYNRIAVETKIKKPYVLLYLLIIPEKVEQYINQVRIMYPGHLIVSIPGSTHAKKMGDLEVADIGPCEFLGLVRDASAVLTSSFHGTVFSIIYRRNFISILPMGTGERISNLLDNLKLTNRIASSPREVIHIDEDINWSDVEEIINIQRKNSLDYLESVI